MLFFRPHCEWSQFLWHKQNNWSCHSPQSSKPRLLWHFHYFHSGELLPGSTSNLSENQAWWYSLQIYQTDHPVTRFSHALLTITVVDSNNHAPEILSPIMINVTIPENAASNYYVTRIKAADRDQVILLFLTYYIPVYCLWLFLFMYIHSDNASFALLRVLMLFMSIDC